MTMLIGDECDRCGFPRGGSKNHGACKCTEAQVREYHRAMLESRAKLAKKKLTEPMQRCLAYVETHGGRIIRYKGGFWARYGIDYEGTPYGQVSNWPRDEVFFGAQTVEALVARGKLEWVEYDRDARIPLEG